MYLLLIHTLWHSHAKWDGEGRAEFKLVRVEDTVPHWPSQKDRHYNRKSQVYD
jgi:hypothetical protein